MPKKKTNYESKGFVRRIAGSIFSSRGGEDISSGNITNYSSVGDTKWRPRKKLFERLDGDDDDDDLGSLSKEQYQNWTIKNVYSTESDAGEYKREILYERKQAAMKHRAKSSNKKRDLTAFRVKPPTKDTQAIRPEITHSASKKKLKTDVGSPFMEEQHLDESQETPFDAFGFHTQNSFASFQHDDESTSRHTMSSRHTASTKHSNPSHHTVSSDPTDFFSKEAVKLTENNLARMAAMSAASATSAHGSGNAARVPGKGKFYQFAIDEDKESTVVESNVGIPFGYRIPEEEEQESVESYDDEEYTDEEKDDSECSPGVGSQKTKVQERNPFTVKKNDFFFRDSERSHRQVDGYTKDFDTFALKKEDPIEENFAFPQNADTNCNVEYNLSDDPFIEPLQAPVPTSIRQASAHSLSYSPSPTNQKKSLSLKSKEQFVRDERLPLSPLGNTKRSNSNRTLGLPPARQSSANQNQKRPDPDSEWKPFRHQTSFSKPDPDAKFDAFALSHKQTTVPRNNTEKRDPSFSSTFPAFDRDFAEDSSTKENPTFSKPDHRRQQEWGLSKQSMRSQKGMAFSSESENECEDDQDSFGSDGLWERSGGRVGLNKFSSTASIGGSVASYGSKRIEIDDNKSVKSFGNASTAGQSFTKPLGLPSNAIMASMLFRTHYNIDQQDVEEKIKAKEEENSKNKKARRGDIPDAVHADHDYMTNVSSFSEETSHFQETWRKPSRDLLDYFSHARTMHMDTRERLERQKAKAKAMLFEA
ncbi:hypothetical protein IV203_030972 [Nitzschia inconspicua]|uniref:Uncharacterized protein n=1 Tax=Nitzschia inconspicua TaxID=303405 RepID=A0A9K3P839_9STRA|nr:hypothetical protein IV203_011200 [Nitzschia inconspicua]KAG7368229.1 hypothetical protein IV203_030972 [Nitzschia inconspicua]